MESEQMDELVKLAVDQGYVVRTKYPEVHTFEIGNVAITVQRIPNTAVEWHRLLAALIGAGLRWPRHRRPD